VNSWQNSTNNSWFQSRSSIAFASLIAADESRLGKDVVSHRHLEIRLGHAGRQIQACVECVQLEVVAMAWARWWARPAITDVAEVITALPAT
jgi:hypothetical protein